MQKPPLNKPDCSEDLKITKYAGVSVESDLVDKLGQPSEISGSGRTPAASKKRHAVHLHHDTWLILAELSTQTSVSQAGIIHTLLIERDNNTLTNILRNARQRRRGRPKQSFFTD